MYDKSFTTPLEINFLESNQLEVYAKHDAEKRLEISARNFFRLVLMGWQDNWQEYLSKEMYSALFLKYNPKLLVKMRTEFQKGLIYVFEQLKNQEFNEIEKEQINLYLASCLDMLPYLDFNPHECLTIPTWVNDQLTLIEYHIDAIELTPEGTQNPDRVFCFGLSPLKSKPMAESLLIFSGTTFPAGHGFITQVNADAGIFKTCGIDLYQSGHKNIAEWLEHQKSDVHVLGSSLGGSLALLLAIHQGDKIKRVDALNPAGLFPDWWGKTKWDRWDDLEKKPEVVVVRQHQDKVAENGIFKEDMHFIQMKLPEDHVHISPFLDHVLCYSGFKGIECEFIDIQEENSARDNHNYYIYGWLRTVIAIFIIIPFTYTALPAFRYIRDHLVQTATYFMYFSLLCLCNPLALSLFPGAALANFFISSFFLAHATETWVAVIKKLFFNPAEDAEKPNKLLFNDLPNYITIPYLILAITACVMTFCLFPPILPFISYAFMAFPFIFNCASALISGINALISKPNYDEPPHHLSEKAHRVHDLDGYKNTTDDVFSAKKLAQYYYAKRVILKGKPYQVDEKSENSHINFLNDSKADLLEKFNFSNSDLVNPEDLESDEEDYQVTCNATKAKIVDIKKTLGLIDRFGLFQNDESETAKFKQMLLKQDQAYKKGKLKMA